MAKRHLVVAAVVVFLLALSVAPARALVAPVLSGAVIGGDDVSLTWTDAGNETSYSIRYSSDGGVDYTTIATLGKNILSYQHPNRTAGDHFYRVRAHKGGTTLESNTVQLTVGQPPPPECSDGVNNDPAEDSLIDFPADPGCASPADTTEFPNPPPPGSCTGVQVPAGADLNAVIPNGQAETYCLSAGTYELGTASLGYDSGDVIIGQPVTFGPNGEVTAPTAIHSTAVLGVIRGLAGKPTLTVDSLDICCSPNSGTDGQRGRGINGNGGALVNLTVLNSRIHGNGINGIGAVGLGLVVDHTEIDHNGAAGGDGISAGIKVTHYAEVRNSYIHDNNNNGMWWDCDAPGGVIENSRLEANSRSGVFVEISSGDATSGESIPAGATYGFKVLNNVVPGNNASGAAVHSGILVESSRNVTVDGNTATNNLQYNIHVLNDSRQNNGHAECSSGFVTANVTVQNNQFGPANINGCALTGVTCLNNTKIL